LSLHDHLIFGTKDHLKTIRLEWRSQLHAYLGGIVRAANGVARNSTTGTCDLNRPCQGSHQIGCRTGGLRHRLISGGPAGPEKLAGP
jgi:hypothetical protein